MQVRQQVTLLCQGYGAASWRGKRMSAPEIRYQPHNMKCRRTMHHRPLMIGEPSHLPISWGLRAGWQARFVRFGRVDHETVRPRH